MSLLDEARAEAEERAAPKLCKLAREVGAAGLDSVEVSELIADATISHAVKLEVLKRHGVSLGNTYFSNRPTGCGCSWCSEYWSD